MTAVIAFTEAGMALSRRIADALGGAALYAPAKRAAEGCAGFDSVQELVAQVWSESRALVFVGAAGIAVRAIAPHVASKATDPAVIVVDEAGEHVIPLLSGHIGGANELARTLERALGAEAVITTATDVRGVFAVDSWAVGQGLFIDNPAAIVEVSSRLLHGEPVGLRSEYPIVGALPQGIDTAAHECGIVIGDAEPFAVTLRLLPRNLVVGIGCRRGAAAEQIGAAVKSALAQHGLDARRVCALASIDLKRDEAGLLEYADKASLPLHFFSAQELAQAAGAFTPSDFVRETTGVDNVCERSAALHGGEGRLIAPKTAQNGVTVAVFERDYTVRFGDAGQGPGVLRVVGIGPGGKAGMTFAAYEALRTADVIVGYTAYVELVKAILPHKAYYATGMMQEIDRCRAALELAAEGKRVAMVCSGDAGVYGMASPVLELSGDYPGVAVEIVCGVTAASSGGALLGAPLGHDFATISLSDLLTPWEAIERRLRHAAGAGLAICLYNPGSHRRHDYLQKACDILLEQLSGGTVCGIARNIGRAGESARVLTLSELRDTPVDMFTTAFIGTSRTREIGGRMVMPRGYRDV